MRPTMHVSVALVAGVLLVVPRPAHGQAPSSAAGSAPSAGSETRAQPAPPAPGGASAGSATAPSRTAAPSGAGAPSQAAPTGGVVRSVPAASPAARSRTGAGQSPAPGPSGGAVRWPGVMVRSVPSTAARTSTRVTPSTPAGAAPGAAAPAPIRTTSPAGGVTVWVEAGGRIQRVVPAEPSQGDAHRVTSRPQPRRLTATRPEPRDPALPVAGGPASPAGGGLPTSRTTAAMRSVPGGGTGVEIGSRVDPVAQPRPQSAPIPAPLPPIEVPVAAGGTVAVPPVSHPGGVTAGGSTSRAGSYGWVGAGSGGWTAGFGFGDPFFGFSGHAVGRGFWLHGGHFHVPAWFWFHAFRPGGPRFHSPFGFHPWWPGAHDPVFFGPGVSPWPIGFFDPWWLDPFDSWRFGAFARFHHVDVFGFPRHRRGWWAGAGFSPPVFGRGPGVGIWAAPITVYHVSGVAAPSPVLPPHEPCALVIFRTTAGTEYELDVALPALDAITVRELQLTLERDMAAGRVVELTAIDGVAFRLDPEIVAAVRAEPCP